MTKKILVTLLLLIITVVLSSDLMAQCPMCRMSLESNLENGGTAGAGINKGILYMLAAPYLIVATIGFMWYRHNRRPGDLVRDRN
ncbi:MAG: hypothetical protein KJP00_12180 [Bacteroidia bacterium]|nr:hypothetical protein [Bacteroidia bacterium]